VKGNARATFCQAQMKGAMTHLFKIILETIYNPVPQILEPYQEIVGRYCVQDSAPSHHPHQISELNCKLQ